MKLLREKDKSLDLDKIGDLGRWIRRWRFRSRKYVLDPEKTRRQPGDMDLSVAVHDVLVGPHDPLEVLAPGVVPVVQPQGREDQGEEDDHLVQGEIWSF